MWGNCDIERSVAGVQFRLLNAIEMEIEPHVHEDSHLIFVLTGNYITNAENAPRVSSGPILVDNPAGTAHRDRFLGPGGRFVAINLPLTAAREGRAVSERSPYVIARMILIAQEIALDAGGLPLEEVAAGLIHRDEPNVTEKLRPTWLDRVFEMIMDTPAGELSLDDLASIAEVHPVHLARSFRRYFGLTAGQMLRARQFEQACVKLDQKRDGIAEIASDLGFCDQSHFSHFFKRRSGTSPLAYRQRMAEV